MTDIVKTPDSYNGPHCQRASLLFAPDQFNLTCISANNIGCLLWVLSIQSTMIILSSSTGFIISLRAGSENQSPLNPAKSHILNVE